MKPASYELRINKDGSYCLIIQGAIKYDGLTFGEAIARIKVAEKSKEEKKNA